MRDGSAQGGFLLGCEIKGLWAGLGHVYGGGGGRRGGAGCAEQDEGHCRVCERVCASPLPVLRLPVLTPCAGRSWRMAESLSANLPAQGDYQRGQCWQE